MDYHQQQQHMWNNEAGGTIKYCGVCGDVAKSFHFGGLSCDSCKAFFRRSVQNDNYLNFQCAHQGCCVISLANRKSCQYCRMRGCFNIGMEKSWVMTEDERKALMKARAEKKMKSMRTAFTSGPSTSESGSTTATGEEETSSVYTPRLDRMIDFMEPLEIKEIESIVTKYLHAYEHVPYRTELRNVGTADRSGAQVMEMFGTLIRRYAYYARLMPDFASLPFNDQSILLKGGVLEMCLLRGVLVFDPVNNHWPNVNMAMYKNAPVLKLDNIVHLTSNKLFQMHMDFIKCVKQMNVDEPIIMLLILIVLFTPERTGLQCSDWVDRYQGHYTTLLEHYINWRYGMRKAQTMFSKLLTKLSDLRELSDFHNHHNLRLDEEEVASIQDQLKALKLNPYRELKVVPEGNDPPPYSSSSEFHACAPDYHQPAATRDHYQPPVVAAPAHDSVLKPKDYSSTISESELAQSDTSASSSSSSGSSSYQGQQQSGEDQMAQFMQAVHQSVDQVANAPHFGFEWIKPDYQFDYNMMGSAHQHQAAALSNERDAVLTDEELDDFYEALESYTETKDPRTGLWQPQT